MRRKTQLHNVIWYVASFLLAGLLHYMDRQLNMALLRFESPQASALPAFGSTLLFVLNLAIYCVLLIWWMQSVYTRLLPSRARVCIVSAAVLMLAFLLIRSVKYRLAGNGGLLEHLCWYLYYVPLALIPALFLMTCLSMEPERKGRSALFWLALGAALLLSLLVVTNDLHWWMFAPVEGARWDGSWGGYTVGPLWYFCYGFVIVSVLLGLILLAMTDRRQRSGRRTLLPSLLLLGTLGMMVLSDRLLGPVGLPFPWAFPELSVFCMLGIFESCIQSRLIPYNEHYVEFFHQTRLPAEITDPALRPVYSTQTPISATSAQRRQALSAPLLLDEDTRLYGKALDAGYAFWTGDERTLRELNESLADAAEVLESENELLRYESEQARERVRVDARNRVYAKAASEVYETQKQIAVLLARLHPDAPDYSATLAQILLLDAYVKRKTNFVLLSAERNTVTAQELYLALEESARFLTLCGTHALAERKTERVFSQREAAALYDSFERLIEGPLGQVESLLILLADEGVRLMADGAPLQTLPQTPAPVTLSCEDGQTYLTIRAEKGGAA